MKKSISKQSLITLINQEIDKNFPHENHHCVITEIRKIKNASPNWAIVATNSGGNSNTLHASCKDVIEKISLDLSKIYEID